MIRTWTATRRLDGTLRAVERALRLLGDPRLGVGLLIAAGLANVVAAAEPRSRWLLDTPPYLAVVGAIVITGIAAVAVRFPAIWREWRRPTPLSGRGNLLAADIAVDDLSEERGDRLAEVLSASGYRVRLHRGGQRWILAGVKHGSSRFAGLASHLGLVLLVVGAAIGTAFAEETRFGLFPGEQSFLAAPRPGMTSAVRLDRLDARFDPQTDLPTRFDTHVTFLTDGHPIRSQVLRVNEPGDIDGYLVHAWTYGPAVTLRVEDLGGGTLFDGWVALGGEPTGSRAPFVELPQLGMTIGVEIAEAAANTVRLIAADDAGRLLDTAVIGPRQPVRIGSTVVTLDRFASYVTFLSRRDPGVFVLFAGAGVLVASLAVAFYLPRRRIDLAPIEGGLRLRLRGERFEQPNGELERLVSRLSEALR